MNEIFENLYEMTAFSNIIAEPQFLIMYAIAFVLLYLGIKKQYEPLLLVPIAFGVLLANFPGGDMGVIQADENGMVMVNGVLKNIWEMPLHDIAHELGIMNFIYYMLIKTGFLPPIIFMGVGALTDFGPMLRNLHLSIFGAAAQLGIFTVLLVAILMGFTPQEAASLGIIGGADGPEMVWVEQQVHCHADFTGLVHQRNQRFRLQTACGFLHCQSHQLVRRLHGGHRHNFVADGDVSGLGAFGQHRIDRRNGDVGRTDRLNIKAGEDVLPQRVEDTGNNARNVENFPCNLADHDVGVIVLGDSSDGVTTLDACLPQNVQVDGHTLDGETGKIVRKQVEAFPLLGNDGDVMP